MAVNAVDNIVDTPITAPPESGGSSRVKISAETLAKMTAQEILDGYEKQNWDVPENIITWARQEVQTNPGSKTTWGEASKAGAGQGGEGEENDAVQYAAMLEGQDMSLKEICKEFIKISSEKEGRDLSNIVKVAPFAQNVPADEEGGDKGESEVDKVLKEIKKDGIKSGMFGKNYMESLMFFQAFKQGTKNEVDQYDFDLKEIQNVLENTLEDAKDSKQWGDETIVLGKKLKDKTSGWQIFGSRRRTAKKAIAQGENTVKMSERTSKLTTAIAKDNKIALKSVEDNIKVISESETPGGDSNGSNPPSSPAPGNPS